MNDLLKQYAELSSKQLEIAAELAAIVDQIRAEVTATKAPIAAHGFIAYYKPGRKSTDHEAAVKAILDGAAIDVEYGVNQLIKKYSTTKTTTAWAKVTKEAGIDTTDFTTEGEPQFTIEVLK